MSILLSLHIRNFQGHKDTKVSFVDGVNVIIGHSEKGKSTILRALDWLCYNSFRGDWYRSKWGGSTEVHGEFDNGTVSRIRNKKFNGYVLNGEEHAGGIGVPDPVRDFINMSEINMQTSRELPFLISWSPPRVGRYLNKITNLEIIDRTTTNNNKDIQENKRVTKYTKEGMKAKREALREHRGLQELKGRADAIEELIGQASIINLQIKSISNLVQQYRDVKRTIKQISPILKLESNINELVQLMEQSKRIKRRIKKVQLLLDELKNVSYRIKRAKEKVDSTQKQLHKITPRRCPLCGNESKTKDIIQKS